MQGNNTIQYNIKICNAHNLTLSIGRIGGSHWWHMAGLKSS